MKCKSQTIYTDNTGNYPTNGSQGESKGSYTHSFKVREILYSDNNEAQFPLDS
jgi:hypothetical protein